LHHRPWVLAEVGAAVEVDLTLGDGPRRHALTWPTAGTPTSSACGPRPSRRGDTGIRGHVSAILDSPPAGLRSAARPRRHPNQTFRHFAEALGVGAGGPAAAQRLHAALGVAVVPDVCALAGDAEFAGDLGLRFALGEQFGRAQASGLACGTLLGRAGAADGRHPWMLAHQQPTRHFNPRNSILSFRS
jgi:hypothetical protein